MKNRNTAIALSVIALGVAAWVRPGMAQGPLWDRVNVTLPYSVTVGEKTLQPGDYVIQQLSSNSGSSRVLLIYSNQGMKFETSAMTIPALDNKTQEDTKVILHHYGPDYYFDRIWIQGKDYGYEFPLPGGVKARETERSEPVAVAATYQSVDQNSGNQNSSDQNSSMSSSQSSTTTSNTTTSSSNTTATQPQTDVTTNTDSNNAMNNNSGMNSNSGMNNNGMNQSQPSTQPVEQAPISSTYPSSSSSDTSSSSTTTQPSTTSADRDMTQSTGNTANQSGMAGNADRTATQSSSDTTRKMPSTSAGWLMMLLGGGTLSGLGMVLRSKGVKYSR